MRFTIIFLLLSAWSVARAQDNADYYRRTLPQEFSRKKYGVESLLKKTAGDVKIRNRWYIGVDGFLRNDRNTITNTLDDLIGTHSPTVASYAASVGWVIREQWALEAEYARSAIHNDLLIKGDNPLAYRLENDKNVISFRGKRRLLFGKPYLRRSAFWIGGGAALVPNSGTQKSYMEFVGYKEKGRRQGIDTLYLTSDTYTARKTTFLLEATAEYVIKVARVADLSFFARKQWGYGNSLQTELVYSVNSVETDRSVIRGNGTGWSLGISLRYVFQLGYDFKDLNSF
ncbi:hypothetical protein DYBT9275_03030 [Dyadobacter sp. CECT 9275]|uniref:DUF3078 domain-containing protein n=1 Tax=Dyadobacter helix TaxID=2822344 RepID=A0A916JDA2_9BACT|nr:hypothetical protein [Dyadobacter sp. CECT 9275]CAG5003023.1 hypothetical protein DYBT9275_03030 [Dyadobacter sp. CECT 9275]